MSVSFSLKFLLTCLFILILGLLFSSSVFAQDASPSASPTASATPTPTSSPSPSATSSPTSSPSDASGSTQSSPSPTPKPKEDKVLGVATSLGATGREIDFIKWVLLAAVFFISLFIGLKALRGDVKE